jgi:ubiquinone/menaquinone biosynthesis C-methylase UbiE
LSEKNVELWTKNNVEFTDGDARRAWAKEEFSWGIWGIPEAELHVLGDVTGLDVAELGCGTAYCAARLARMGATVVGVDPTPAQLETARRMQSEFGLEFPLVEAFGEDVPLSDASFDLAISEYGASIWADPFRWIPEAARLLRPGGRLVFLRSSTLAMLCAPDVGQVEERLQRPLFGMYRLDWPENDGAVEYHLPTGELFELLRANGFVVERLVELRAPADAETHGYYGHVSAEWGRQWPAEELWAARKNA